MRLVSIGQLIHTFFNLGLKEKTIGNRIRGFLQHLEQYRKCFYTWLDAVETVSVNISCDRNFQCAESMRIDENIGFVRSYDA